jgi:hypothetical protein
MSADPQQAFRAVGDDPRRLVWTASSFAMLKKYVERCREWVGLGWNVNSSRSVDLAMYARYDWRPANLSEISAKP